MKTTRDLILKYMRHKRASCETTEIATAIRRSKHNTYQNLKSLMDDGIIRTQRQSNNTVRWFLRETEAA